MTSWIPVVIALRFFAGGDAGHAKIARAPDDDRVDRWFAEDKLRHFAMSFAIVQLAGGAARAAGADRDASIAVGAGASAAAGVWKEWRDRRHDLPFSFRDLTADGLGIATGAVLQRQIGQ